MSKSGKPLGRYFPEVVEAVLALKADRFVLDGELIIRSAARCPSTRCSCASTPPRAASASSPPRRRRS
jgi:hypothetical protein